VVQSSDAGLVLMVGAQAIQPDKVQIVTTVTPPTTTTGA